MLRTIFGPAGVAGRATALALVVGLLPQLTGGLAAPEVTTDHRRIVAEVEELLTAGSYQQAVKLLTASGQALSPAGDALLGRALALARRYLAAEEPLQRAVDAGQTDPATLFYLGSTLWENGKAEEARAVLEEALAASEGHPALLHQLARLELWCGNWEEAADLLARALAVAPGDLDFILDRARALEGARRSSEALAAYRAVVERAPDHSGARYGLARLLLATGSDEEGRRQLEVYRQLLERERAATRRAGREQATLDRGLALLHAGDFLVAVEHLRGLEPTPDNLDALSRALAAAGRHEESLAALERAVALAPERRDLRDRLTETRLARSPTDRYR